MIEEISDVDHRARASGIGQFSNSLGQIVGLLITLPLAGSRLAPLLPSVAIFFILALPMMIFFKENHQKEKGINIATIKSETKIFRKKFLAFFSLSLATPMLVSFFFFNDAMVTITNNYSIVVERVFAAPDATKSILLIAIIVMSAIGGIVAGFVGDKIGLLKTLKIILVGWIIALPAMALAPNFTVFKILTPFVGLLIGSMFTTSRAYMSTLLSKEEMGYGFSFYTLFERFATFVGPLTWGGIIWFLGTGSSSYRIAMATMTIFVITGFITLSVWKKKNQADGT